MKMMTKYFFFLTVFFCFSTNMSSQTDTIENIQAQKIVADVESIELKTNGSQLFIPVSLAADSVRYSLNGNTETSLVTNSQVDLDIDISHKGELLFLSGEKADLNLYHVSKNAENKVRVKQIPLWMSIIPPLIAIIFALIFKEVLISLFLGIWAGAFIAGGLRINSLYYLFTSFVDTIRKYILEALTDSGHMSVIIFSILIGGMVALISKNGGMAGVVKALGKYAKSARSTQFVTYFLGIAIFFDDYANTLIVGNTMRPVTDKFKISREKLAYLVDSTAAPVASIAFITTWIGAELGYIADGLSTLELHNEYTPYAVFISSLKYSYYPILTLFFMFLIIYFQKDFGPMHKAEMRARTTGQVSSARTKEEDEPDMEDLTPVKNAPLKWQYAVFPILTVIFVTLFGLFDTGFDSIYSSLDPTIYNYTWGDIWSSMKDENGTQLGFFIKLGNLIGSSDSYVALLWASFAGVVVALLMTVSGKVIKLFDSMHYLVMGFKTMLPAVLILTLAWGLAITTTELHTADFLSNALKGNLNPLLLPGVIFVLAALISFSTGSSWSTMAILFPIAIPTTYTLAMSAGIDADHTMELLYNVIATVLAASVLGDHCSPISDTTILSSLASDCNHLDHVKTQMPYALTVGGISLFCVVMSTYFGGGIQALFFYIMAIVLIVTIVMKFGKDVNVE
jgi:Na+/H+ antiporter NhaC